MADGEILEIDANLYEWASKLKPDFKGRGHGDRFIVLLTWRHPTGMFLWALGHHELDLEAAHQVAIAEISNQRLHLDIGAALS